MCPINHSTLQSRFCYALVLEGSLGSERIKNLPSNPNKFLSGSLQVRSGFAFPQTVLPVGGVVWLGWEHATLGWQICLTTPSLLLPLLPALRLSWEGTPGRWAQIRAMLGARVETGWRWSRAQGKLLAVGGRRPVRGAGRGGSVLGVGQAPGRVWLWG